MISDTKTIKTKFILLLIFALALSLRLYGLDWDQGQHLHPDERFLTMVASSVKIPSSINEYFNAKISPLNPANHEYNFYVYGNLPLLITRSIAEMFNQTSYDQIYLIGRVISAIIDSLLTVIIFKICLFLYKKAFYIGLFASIGYAFAVFPIQQAHFFTTDGYVTLLSTLSIYFFLKYFKSKKALHIIFTGISLGLTLSSKMSVGITIPIYLLLLIDRKQGLKSYLFNSCLLIFCLLISFRIFQPYAFDGLFRLNNQFASNIKTAHQMITGEYDYPPNVQWIGTPRLLHPLFNIATAGIGPTNFILIVLGLKFLLKKKKIFKKSLLLLLFSCLVVFLYQGIQLAKYMRYFYPIYPLIFIIVGYFLSKIQNPRLVSIIIFINIISCLSFLNIYSKKHSRVLASEWICSNVPNFSTISSESWDDTLPLRIETCQSKEYKEISLGMYDIDSEEKITHLNNQLREVKYLVLSSNRVWGSIPKFPSRYPYTSNFYKKLFNDQLEFEKVKEIYSYPGFDIPYIGGCILIGPSNYPGVQNNLIEFDNKCQNPGIYFRDDILEESFTVYDHPKVVIFKHR